MSIRSEYSREIEPVSSRRDINGTMHYFAANGEEVIAVHSIAAWAGDAGIVVSGEYTTIYPKTWAYKRSFYYRGKADNGVNRSRS